MRNANAFFSTDCAVRQKRKAAIQDDSLSDPDCVFVIEEIITALEQIGSSGASRHDW